MTLAAAASSAPARRGILAVAGGAARHQGVRALSSLPAGDGRGDPRSKELRADVKKLGKVLGKIICEENEAVYDHVERLRHLAKDFRSGEHKEAFNEMVDTARKISAGEARGVARAFSHFLAMSNCAETHHRVREMEMLRQQKRTDTSPFPPKEDSCRGAITALLEEEGLSPREVRNTLLQQRVELVLTAHPTEINRRTVLEKHRRIGKMLAASDTLDRVEAGAEAEAGESFERRELRESLRREVASLFFSDEIRRFKPTPLHEAQGGLAVVESVLWDAVPRYLRKLDTELVRQLTAHGLTEEEARLPLDRSPIRFASWMGGDRDGNPNVTPEITERVCALNRWKAASLYSKDLAYLYDELSMSTGFSQEVVDMAAALPTKAESVELCPDGIELYRRLLGDLRRRMAATLAKNEPSHSDVDPARSLHDSVVAAQGAEPLTLVRELMTPLMAIYNSLVASGRREIADGRLADVIRRVSVFGLTIVPLDIRQESGRHLEAMDAITRHLGLGSYAQWSEDTKINWLCQELGNSRPLLAHEAVQDFASLGFSPTVQDTLNTFRAIAQMGEGSLGAYVISQAKAASDVLAVALLQQEFGMTLTPAAAGEGGNAVAEEDGVNSHMLRVVPLFETLTDLNNAPAIMDRLLRLPAYMGRIGGRVEIMVGYSDSAKDAGRLAACWAQYRCQEELLRIAKDVGGIELTFFHGKGGTVGRGGSPAVYRAVLSHPPNTIDGRFRVTEQGEMITQNFGHQSIAERTLDVYTAAVLREKHHVTTTPKPEWREAMDLISDVSCKRYRQLVREEPSFVPYFRAVTPETHLSGLNVGSRPAKRNPKGGVESLRAIPWIFAWSQTRCHLPAWLGVNEGLKADAATAAMHDMYRQWPWFRELLDLIAMILAKADHSIVENYDRQLIPVSDAEDKEALLRLGELVRAELSDTQSQVLSISGQDDLNMGNQVLERELAVRAPYLDALNVLQCEVMRRLQEGSFSSEAEREELEDCLLITINGIAAGLRNSG